MNRYDFKNILLINYGGIGDEILFLPTINSVKKEFPKAKITLALEPRSKSIKNLTDDIDEVVCIDIKAKGLNKYLNMAKFIVSSWFKNYDCVISSGKSPLVAIILFLLGIKCKVGYNSKFDFLLNQKVKLNENQYAAKMYHDLAKPLINNEYTDPTIKLNDDYFELDNKLKNSDFICIHPGVSKMSISKGIIKCPDINFWKNLISGLLNNNKKVVLLGTKDDEDLINKIISIEEIINNSNFINYFNKTKSLLEMAYIMKKAEHVICVDSAPLHVAVCINADIFAIFGPTNELKLVPNRENVKVIKSDVACRPCLWHKRVNNCQDSECLNINFEKILNLIH